MDNKIKIPKSFKLFGTTIKVIFDDKFCNARESYGYSSYGESSIRLTKTDNLIKLSNDKIEDTFYHEKVHIILDTMGEYDLSKNEKFIDTFAKLLRQSDIDVEH